MIQIDMPKTWLMIKGAKNIPVALEAWLKSPSQASVSYSSTIVPPSSVQDETGYKCHVLLRQIYHHPKVKYGSNRTFNVFWCIIVGILHDSTSRRKVLEILEDRRLSIKEMVRKLEILLASKLNLGPGLSLDQEYAIERLQNLFRTEMKPSQRLILSSSSCFDDFTNHICKSLRIDDENIWRFEPEKVWSVSVELWTLLYLSKNISQSKMEKLESLCLNLSAEGNLTLNDFLKRAKKSVS